MKRRGLIRLMDDCNGRNGRPAEVSKSKAHPTRRPEHYVRPDMRFESRYFDHSEPVTLSVTAVGMAEYMPFIADHTLSGTHSFAQTGTHSQPFYVEPFEESTEEAPPVIEPARYEEVEVGGRPADTTAPTRPTAPARPTVDSRAEADEFEADLRRILEGKKRYEGTQRKMPPAEASPPPHSSPPSSPPPAAPAPQDERPKNEHEIFERIAQSMKLANAYDLGSVALNQRFDSFDREMDARVRKKGGQTSPPQTATEFLEDMDEIGRRKPDPKQAEQEPREPEEADGPGTMQA